MPALPPLPRIALGRYRHFKGGEYEVLGIARCSETLEPLVLYRPIHGDESTWARLYAMFTEAVEMAGEVRSRFMYLGE